MTQDQQEYTELLDNMAADLPRDLFECDEDGLRELETLTRAIVTVMGSKPHLRGARFVAHSWLDLLQAELIRRGFQAADEVIELERIFSLETE